MRFRRTIRRAAALVCLTLGMLLGSLMLVNIRSSFGWSGRTWGAGSVLGRIYFLHFSKGQWTPGLRTDPRAAAFGWMPVWSGNPWADPPRLFTAAVPNWMLMLPCFAAAAMLARPELRVWRAGRHGGMPCPECGYNLAGLGSGGMGGRGVRCPECGKGAGS